jgi:hypothetical protein
VIAIALSTIAAMDLLVVLDEGRVVEQATPQPAGRRWAHMRGCGRAPERWVSGTDQNRDNTAVGPLCQQQTCRYCCKLNFFSLTTVPRQIWTPQNTQKRLFSIKSASPHISIAR